MLTTLGADVTRGFQQDRKASLRQCLNLDALFTWAVAGVALLHAGIASCS